MKEQSPPSSLQHLLVHFKNSIHEGTFSQNTNRRDGLGITLLDSGSIIIGDFKQDQLNGLSIIYITLDTYFLGQISKGCLNGPFVIRSPSLTVYSKANINKIDGQILVINYESKIAQLWFVDADGSCQISKQMNIEEYLYKGDLISKKNQKINRAEESKMTRVRYIALEEQILAHLAPYIEIFPDISGFLKQHPDFDYRSFGTNQIIYLADPRRDPQSFLGVALNRNQEVIAYGVFSESQHQEKMNLKNRNPGRGKSFEQDFNLNGMGYLYIEAKDEIYSETQVIYEGEFMNHRLQGQGSKEILKSNKSVYGQFHHGDIRSMDIIASSQSGNETVRRLLQKRKKSIHVHSLQFINNYANQRPIIILKNLLRIILKSEQQNNFTD